MKHMIHFYTIYTPKYTPYTHTHKCTDTNTENDKHTHTHTYTHSHTHTTHTHTYTYTQRTLEGGPLNPSRRTNLIVRQVRHLLCAADQATNSILIHQSQSCWKKVLISEISFLQMTFHGHHKDSPERSSKNRIADEFGYSLSQMDNRLSSWKQSVVQFFCENVQLPDPYHQR